MSLKVRKKIAVLTSQPESAYQSQFLEGFLSEAFANDYDVVVFSTFLKGGYSYGFQHGELNIFTLCDADLFDAVVIIPYMLELGGVYKKLLKHLKEKYKKPVVVVDRQNDYFTNITANDDEAIFLLVDHIISKHHCKDIAFLNGPIGHEHTNLRMSGYLRALKKHGIEVHEDRIYYGDFWYDAGERLVERLIAEKNLPQAIVCASEHMAISVVQGLRKNGVSVPKEVIVTGFDCEGDALRDYHSVTSVHRHNRELGREVFSKVDCSIRGLEYTYKLPPYSSKDIVFKSCGCYDRRHKVQRAERDERFFTAYDVEGFESGYNFMLEDMTGQDCLSDALWTLSWYTKYIGEFDKFSLCLCEDWCDIKNYSDELARTTDYSEQMILALVQKGGSGKVDLEHRFNQKDILPEIVAPREQPAVFYCTPTHYNEKVIGYSVISYENKPKVYPVVFTRWVRYMNVALESLHRQLVTRNMYEIMKVRALMDELTGVYNRNGLYNLAPDIIQSAIDNKSKLLIVTGDMNCMKFINDNYGHGEGDFALKKCAEAFTTITKDIGGHTFRTGGDEFVYMAEGNFEFEQVGKLINDIRDQFVKLLAEAGKPYPAQVALGYSCSTIQGFDTMEKLLSPADNMMYEDKKKIKEETGYKFARK